MKFNISSKKFQKKWPKDEWLEKNKNGEWRLITIGNLKKWISIKYYGHAERLRRVDTER
jgi:hypothetical protein